MTPVIDSSRFRVRVGTVPKTGNKIVKIDVSGYHSLGNRAERAATRRFAKKLLELCDAHEPPVCIDYASCSDCGKVFFTEEMRAQHSCPQHDPDA